MTGSISLDQERPAIRTFDKRQLRDVLGSFVTGVTVITTRDAEGKMHGLTANSFSSVSLDPPLVLWSQATSAGSHSAFRDAGRFTINILAEHQHGLANHFEIGRASCRERVLMSV